MMAPDSAEALHGGFFLITGGIPGIWDAMEKRRIIIVGAGPAGLACAIALKRAGENPLVLEKSRSPEGKPCGGGLTPRALRLIRKLGLDLSLGRPFYKVGCNSPPWHYNLFTTERPALNIVRREEFNRSLLALADRSGVEVRRARALFARYAGGDFFLSTDAGDFSCQYLAAADGPASRVRRSLGGRVPRISYAVMVDGVENERVPDHVVFDGAVMPAGYGWVFPYGDGSANAGVFNLGRPATGTMRGLLDRYLDARLATDSAGRRVQGGIGVWGVYRLPRQVPALLLGDAGGFLDPLTGEGIYQALYTGNAAAQAILRRGPGEARAAYEASTRLLRLNYRAIALLTDWAYRHPREGGRLLRPWFIRAPLTEALLRGMNTSLVAAGFPVWLLLALASPVLKDYRHLSGMSPERAAALYKEGKAG